MVHYVDGLFIQADTLASVARTIGQGREAVADHPLQRVATSSGAFSTTWRGASLEGHHQRALGVMSATLTGLADDLERFSQALLDLNTTVERLEADVAADFDTKAAAVEALQTAAHTHAADQAYAGARGGDSA